jgi:predicted nucleic acid-binding Zn ribbon protein
MNENTCVCCGAQIPEGRQVCWNCEHETERKSKGGLNNDIRKIKI